MNAIYCTELGPSYAHNRNWTLIRLILVTDSTTLSSSRGVTIRAWSINKREILPKP